MESEPGNYVLLVRAGDEVLVDGPGVVGLRSAARHAENGQRTPKRSWLERTGSGVEWSGVENE